MGDEQATGHTGLLTVPTVDGTWPYSACDDHDSCEGWPQWTLAGIVEM